MWIAFVAGRTTESQIATGGDLSFSLCVACRVNLTLNELKLVDIKKIMIILRKAKPEWFSPSDIR